MALAANLLALFVFIPDSRVSGQTVVADPERSLAPAA
jgi:hypothetical protein